jgi:hypothetical protein
LDAIPSASSVEYTNQNPGNMYPIKLEVNYLSAELGKRFPGRMKWN